MIALYILLIICGIILLGLVVSMIYKNFEKKKNLKNSVVEKKKFKMVKSFDENSYIESAFDQVFHSIRIDDWEIEVDNGIDSEIKFKKALPNGNWNDKVTLSVKYKSKNGNFVISNIFLSAGEFFAYDVKKINDDDYEFFYNCYVKHMEEYNEKVKLKVDKSLETIHKVIGKAAIRDSKIDDILS